LSGLFAAVKDDLAEVLRETDFDGRCQSPAMSENGT
jgi:hypothetical protein